MEAVWFGSPVSKSDAAERSGSISADKQTQVAVWKGPNTEAGFSKKTKDPIDCQIVL